MRDVRLATPPSPAVDSHTRGAAFAWRTTFALLTCVPSLAQDTTPPPIQRPRFQFLRQNEDWSEFRTPATGAGFFEGLKHVPLSADGSIWVSFGGRVESRFEAWNNFASAEANDEGTNALMSDYIREQEKLVWMYSAFLKK